MKHKAQECFERIYQQDYEAFDSSCLVAVEDSDMRYEEDCDTLQELINCQLNESELSIVDEMICVILAEMLEQKKFELVNYLVPIREKIKKQKEMWVSEDETN